MPLQETKCFNEPKSLLGIETGLVEVMPTTGNRFNEPKSLLGIETREAVAVGAEIAVSMNLNPY